MDLIKDVQLREEVAHIALQVAVIRRKEAQLLEDAAHKVWHDLWNTRHMLERQERARRAKES